MEVMRRDNSFCSGDLDHWLFLKQQVHRRPRVVETRIWRRSRPRTHKPFLSCEACLAFRSPDAWIYACLIAGRTWWEIEVTYAISLFYCCVVRNGKTRCMLVFLTQSETLLLLGCCKLLRCLGIWFAIVWTRRHVIHKHMVSHCRGWRVFLTTTTDPSPADFSWRSDLCSRINLRRRQLSMQIVT